MRDLAAVRAGSTPVVVVASAVVVALLWAAPASAAAPTIKVQPKRVHAGDVVRVSGNAGGCATGNRVTLISRAFSRAHTFAGVPAAITKVKPNGRYRVLVRIPGGRQPKRYAVTGRCGGGNFGVTSHLRVLKRNRTAFCSSSGDLCYGIKRQGQDAILRIDSFVNFSPYRLCVQAPAGAVTCKRFRLHAEAGGLFGSKVRWSTHFPNGGKGVYRVRWRAGGNSLGPRLRFRRR
jgi:hypothetical protein